MRPTPFASVLLALGLFLPAGSRAELVMTAPESLVAGTGSTLLLRLLSLGDRDLTTAPVAGVDGNAIRVDLRAECEHPTCDVVTEHLFRVDLPPLAQGEYTVTVYADADADEPRETFGLTVGPGGGTSAVSPSDGFWMPVGMPGTGLHLQLRGETLAVSQFDQVDGDADWRLDAVPLHGDSAIVLLRDYQDGSCLGCLPHVEPIARTDGTAMRLHFDSARTATAEVLDGSVVPLVNLPFGAAYVAKPPIDTTDETFGPLALPDISGTWAIAGGLVNRIVEFSGPVVQGNLVSFHADDGDPEVSFRCSAVQDGLPCALEVWNSMPPVAFGVGLGNVTENMIRFQPTLGEAPTAVRIPQRSTESVATLLPAEGFWSIPGRPGTGMHFQHRGDLLAVSQFDFIDGESHWRLGVAPLGLTRTEVVLHSHSGGSCFGCTPHVAPVQDDGPVLVTIEFDSARRATLDLGDGNTVALVNLPFGAPYVDAQLPGAGDDQFGPLPLPDLSGTWVFDLPASYEMRGVVTLQGPIIDGETVRFERDRAEGERFALICSPGDEAVDAGCELRIGDFEIGTPPPGWYPFARLGDIEHDRIRLVGGTGPVTDWPVYYAVRIPDAR